MRPSWWVLIAVVGLTAWLFGSALLGTHTFVFRDGAHYFPPLFGFNVEEWRAGRVPLWNPYEQIGLPALAENTASVFYPGQLILLLPVPFLWAYNLYVVAHVVLAAYGAFRLARYGGTSILAAGQAGLAYAFSGSVLFQYCNVIFLIGAAWLPFALLATDRLLRGCDLRSAAWLGLVWALMVLGGDPQMAYNAALLAAAYACCLSWQERRSSGATAAAAESSTAGTAGGSQPKPRGNFTRRIVLLSAAAGSGLTLAAVQILPTWELAAMGPRARHDLPRSLWELAGSSMDRAEPFVQPDGPLAQPGKPSKLAALVDASAGGEHLQKAYQFSVGPWRWLELVWPNVSGRQFPIHRRWVSALPSEGRIWTPSLYCGAMTLVLAFGGWRLRRSDPWLRCCGWMTAWAALAGWGEYGLGWLMHTIADWAALDQAGLDVGNEFGGLYWLMNLLLPGYVAFRYPAKLWTIAALGISLLAARGWDAAWADAKGVKAAGLRLASLGAISACLMVIVLLVRGWLAGRLAAAPPDPIFGPLDATGALNDVLAGLLQTGIVCGAAACLLMVAQRRWPALAPLALLLLSVGDLAVAHRWLVPCVEMSAWQKVPKAAQTVLADAADPAGPPPRIYRDSQWLPPRWKKEESPNRLTEMFVWDRETLLPKYHLPLHIGSVASSGMLIPGDYFALWETHPTLVEMSIFELLGASGLVLPVTADGSVSSLQPDLRALPRAWIVHRVVVLPPLADNRPSSVRMRNNEVLFSAAKERNWRKEAVVESATPLAYPPLTLPAEPLASGQAERCRIESYQPQRVVLYAELTSPGLIVLADMFYPGWQLTVDDGSGAKPAEILRTDRVLRGVSLPAGKFHLEFRFRPPLFRYGAAISGLAWLGLAMAIGYSAWGRMRRFSSTARRK